MIIQLHKLQPAYLSATHLNQSEVWQHDLTFTAPEGILLWGPSGQGKSSLLRILFGLEGKYTGEVRIDGQFITSQAHRIWPKIRNRKLSFVPQDFQLFEGESGWKNLDYLPLVAEGIDRALLQQWSERLGIDSLLDRTPETWSYGQRQRFCVLRALAKPFQWIFLDEPVSHLDPESSRNTLDLILSECERRQAGWILTQQTPDSTLPIGRTLRV